MASEQETQALEPCPFCGGEARVHSLPSATVVDPLAALTTPAPAVKPHCSTCGKDVAEVLCETCGKWWADNLPPAQAVSRDEIVAVLEEGNRRGLYDTTKIGPELVAFLDDRRGMLASLRDEMSDGYRGWLDDAVDALRIASERLAALTTPAPAEDDDPDDHLGGKLAAAVERELDRIEQRNSTRQDFTPAFDRELARKVIMAGFGLFSCRGVTTASGYQWMELLETLGLDKARPVSTAPAVSRDDQALLADICDNMAEVLKPLPSELPNALGDAGTRATESGDGDEA